MKSKAPFTLGFDGLCPKDVLLVGAKGLVLGQLRQAGLPVPDGFCVSTEAMAAFVRQAGLRERLESILDQACSGVLDARESWAYLGQTRKLMTEVPLPSAVSEAIARAYESLGERVVAVRSSGTREDLAHASFAGQYESFLNVRGQAFLEDAVRGCWASIWRNRVLHYVGRHHSNVSVSDLAMGVVVQLLVKAKRAGVLFTVNPLTGADDQMVVEATAGLGENLVSGRVDPDRFIVDARSGTLLEHSIAVQKSIVRPMYSTDSRGDEVVGMGAQEEDLSVSQQRQTTLSKEDLRALVGLGNRVQGYFGQPMDLEWACDGEQLHIVQARPVTQLSFPGDIGEWTDANFKDGGVASDVCTPFMADLYDDVFSTSMTTWWRAMRILPKGFNLRWLRVFFMRPYWNVGAVKQLLASLPGFVERDFDEDLGITAAYKGPGRISLLTLAGVVKAIPVLWATTWLAGRQLNVAKRFVPQFLADYAEWDALDLVSLSDQQLAQRYRQLLEQVYANTENTYFITVYALSLAKINFKLAFDRLEKAAGEPVSYIDLVCGLEDVAHLRPYEALDALAQSVRSGEELEWGEFLSTWGYHSERELDISFPRWREEPRFVEQIVAKMAQGPSSVPMAELAEAQRQRYGSVAAHVRKLFRGPRLWWRWNLRWRFWRGLRFVRQLAWWREEVRDCSMRCYWLVRKFTLELGARCVAAGKLDDPTDAFMLPWRQLLDLAEGEVDPQEAQADAAWARQRLAAFASFAAPHEIGGVPAPQAPPGIVSAAVLAGVGGSTGVVEGPAKVVRRLDEAGRVEAGDIVVTVFTDPGWTPLLSIVGGLVTETGGLLSHAAVIAREYGIPAVLACKGATGAICDGDQVRIDGASGRVEILGASPPRKGANEL